MDNVEKTEKSLPVLKSGVSLVTGLGISRVISQAVDTVAPQTGMYGKVIVYAAKFGVSSAISVAVDANNDKTIDMIADSVRKVRDAIKNASAE